MADKAPLRVSPLIKLGRWSFLVAGVFYGVVSQNRLSKKEAKIREVEEKQRAIKEKKLAEEKALAAAAEIRSIEEMMNPKK